MQSKNEIKEEINNITQDEADYIVSKLSIKSDKGNKAAARDYLRANGLSIFGAFEKIERLNSSAPGSKRF